MEVNTAGYYVIPRYLGWEEFLIHARDVLDCGNKMLVQFSMEEGLELAASEEGEWFIYLKRQDRDFMTRVPFTRDQKFIFNPLSDSWSLDDSTQEIKDLEQIKKALKSDEVSEVIVSGVPMRLIRVQEIAKGVLFFVFLDEDEKKRYYYARRTTKLRIVTDSETGEKKYLLDHIKAMHID